MAKLDKLLDQAKEHLDEGEDVLAAVAGTYETKRMGQKASRSGMLAATDHRVVFYAKKMGGYDLEVFPYKHISSIETSKGMMGHEIKFFASGNEVKLKWIDKKSDAPGLVAIVKDQMTAAHATPAAVDSGGSPDVADQIRKLAQLRDEGLVTDEEFESKRADLLARL
jgi:PH (Pleckstrin Homology) domain-containing protein/putative oligomerization/nucleic acid binding protein